MFLGIVVVRYMIHSFKKPKAAAAESSCNYGLYSDYWLYSMNHNGMYIL